LYHRGIDDAEKAGKFIAPDYDRDIHDPFLLKDAEKAADRILGAIRNEEKVAIYSDYDADGIPGAAMWHEFFARIGYKNFVIYIPHRHDEGFGLNDDAVTELARGGVKLLVTLDCGISDVGPVAHANSLEVDVIITDHHEPPLILPAAFAIIDHKQADCLYPDKNLCGTGVGFKLIQAILKKDRLGMKEGMEKWMLDLVGMATMSDMVPLVGENRVFARYGLDVLRKSPRKGLIKMLSKLRIQQRYVTEDDIAFMITPRINAASRMGVPMDAFRMLTADNDTDASSAADHLDEINNERKGVVAALVKEIKKTLRDRYGSQKESQSIPSVIVLGNPSWRPALLGLAANTCAEEYDRPVFLWGRDGDNAIKGSCRSEGRTHVVELMRAVPEGVFVQFGGHKHSGGFAVANDAVHYLEQRLNEAALSNMEKAALAGVTEISAVNGDEIDAELTLDAVNWNLYNDIAKLAPFGTGNKKPVFLFRNITVESLKIFGKTKEHVELTFQKLSGEKLKAISFFGASSDWAREVQPKSKIDLISTLEKSMFGGKTELRMRVVEVFMGV
jgi:single-stranded-DNA-specific exonuclease